MVEPKVKITDDVRPLSTLKADPKNARRHPEQQIARIARSIETFGYVTKIAIRPDGTMIGGHATKTALERIGGHDKVEVRVVAGLSDKQYRALGLALNKLPEGSSWDEGILAEIVDELQDDDDLAAAGFSDKEIKHILDGDDELEVKEIETGDVEDECWISIRAPLKDQAAILKALEAAIKPFPDATVDLGTIAIG